jgi:DNA-binding CsgD family transcriptional regulator
MDEALIDRIHECAFVPDQWQAILDELAGMASARGGGLIAVNVAVPAMPKSIFSDSIAGPGRAYFEGGYLATCIRSRVALGEPYAGFFRDGDHFTDGEMAEDSYYKEVLYPQGLGWSAVTTLASPTGERMAVTLERERQRGPVEDGVISRLDTLRPHLARSMLTSARLQLERAQVAAATLELLGLPALVFDGAGKVMAANPLIEALNGYLHWRARDRLALVDRSADALLQQAVATRASSGPTRSFALKGNDGQPPMIAHIIPVRLSARDIFARSTGVLMLTPVTLAEAPPVELVQSLFDLTPREARVARSLTAGQSAEQIAADSGLSITTIRSQVRGVLEKTGCARQAEVVSLLGGVAVRGLTSASRSG